jgi:hypothetical protein
MPNPFGRFLSLVKDNLTMDNLRLTSTPDLLCALAERTLANNNGDIPLSLSARREGHSVIFTTDKLSRSQSKGGIVLTDNVVRLRITSLRNRTCYSSYNEDRLNMSQKIETQVISRRSAFE